MPTIPNAATGTIAIQHSVPMSSVPTYVNKVFDGGLTGYYLVKSVVDCFNDSCRLAYLRNIGLHKTSLILIFRWILPW